MDQLLLPTDDAFIEIVAKAIAKDRLHRDASSVLNNTTGMTLDSSSYLEDAFDRVFEALWESTSRTDEIQKSGYRLDARAAISAINLKLLTSSK